MLRPVVLAALLVGCSDPPDDTVAVRFHFEGQGSGTIAVFQIGVGETQFCTDDCTRRFPRGGEPHRVYAPSLEVDTRFSCETCDAGDNGAQLFGPLESDTDVTVRFTAAIEAPLDFAIAGAYMADGDLAITTHTLAAKVSPAGDVRWTTEVATRESIYDLAAVQPAPAGGAYVAIAGSLLRLDAAGAVLWNSTRFTWDLDVLDDGDIMAVGYEGVQRLRSADASVVWTAGSGSSQTSLAVSGTTVFVGTGLGVTRFDAADGAPIGSAWTVPHASPYEMALASDQDGALLVRTHRLLRLDSTTGTPIYDVAQPAVDAVGYPYQLPVGVIVTGTNRALHWAATETVDPQNVHRADGTHLAAADLTGVQTWQHDLPTTGDVQQNPTWPNVVQSATCQGSTCALFGKNMTPVFVQVD